MLNEGLRERWMAPELGYSAVLPTSYLLPPLLRRQSQLQPSRAAGEARSAHSAHGLVLEPRSLRGCYIVNLLHVSHLCIRNYVSEIDAYRRRTHLRHHHQLVARN